MKIQNFPKEFIDALPILRTIEAAGFEAYFVGGSVRDTILGRPIHDVDIATSAFPEEVKSLFKKTVDTGIQHGTVMILDHGNGYEVTTFRTESTYQDYRRPDHVTFVRSLKEDLKRRDFTINALALDEKGEIFDLFSGIDDMNHRLIRAVGVPEERFNEDALRMMRAVRFSSQLDFDVEPHTLVGINDNSSLLAKIAVERINVEFVKMMLGRRPSAGISEMIDSGMAEHVPHFADHIEDLKALTTIDLNLQNEEQVWSVIGFCFDLAESELKKLLRDWKTSNKMIEDVAATVRVLKQVQSNSIENFDLYLAGKENVANANQLLKQVGLSLEGESLTARYSDLQIKSKKELAFGAKDIIANKITTPGPNLGTILNGLETAVVNNEVHNDSDSLKQLAIAIKKRID
ncbi:CCA tRNA nucleotidyltransferase [Lentilactobacillus sp. Marseille-Q4993]|uniref:CCA tRNA nucleotidyltransferase n=1 Tax=Lentilactobacillus sp. Marseille-Q4993 TaxID=3039492 RepID=UPI0024BC0175|nr:CCA tRNA nucleotidyltransferase [Lentilactobacillus sp. Marseille-Q4993]